jgi:2-dehydro-3-deoxygluconokinase
MSQKVITFGEIMMRLNTPGHSRLVQADHLNMTYAGGEANVAASLANFDLQAYFVTKIPDNPVGQAAINYLRRFGVQTEYIVRGGERLGIYFVETGASQRPSLVLYDRKHSAISTARIQEFNWEEILQDVSWFHITGITPALSDQAAVLSLEAVSRAKKAGATVSCDLNYRKNLWSPEKANQVMSKMMADVDMVIANEEDAEKVFQIKAADSDLSGAKLSLDGYKSVAQQINEKFGINRIAITLRESYSASDNGWSAIFYDNGQFYQSRQYKIHIVDRIGGGDAFAGGLIFALLNNYHPQEAVDFAVAASCLKHTLPGDFNVVTLDEVRKLLAGDGSGRVQR